jgi:hypothetical protein
MYSTDEFAALEIMCRERATLAKKEMEFSEAEYWLDGSAPRRCVLEVLPFLCFCYDQRVP